MMSTFRVVQLTQEALKVQCKIDDYEEWGSPALSLIQYQRKEELQRATTFSQHGSIFWALVDDDKEDSNLVAGQTVLYCHCESHRFDCVVHRNSGEIERGYSHHIASVFTLPEYRKRGLATFFMQEVAKQLEKLPRALVSVLYSDIGPIYYDKLGWKAYPSKMATLDVDNPRNVNVDSSCDAEVVWLRVDEKLDEILQIDNARLAKDLASEKWQGQEAFVILPTRDSIEWQFCMGEHVARVRGYEELPSHCGVKITADAFILWSHNFKESTLYIVRARFPEESVDAANTTLVLLNEALEEARKFKLKRVAIWDPPLSLRHADLRCQLEIEFVDRKDSLSSMMMFRHKNDGDTETSLPYWYCNEKYAWV